MKLIFDGTREEYDAIFKLPMAEWQSFKTLLNQTLKDIQMDQKELATRLDAVNKTVTKIGTESTATLQAVADLRKALENGGPVSPEVEAALVKVETGTKAVDDLVPDAVTPPSPITPPSPPAPPVVPPVV